MVATLQARSAWTRALTGVQVVCTSAKLVLHCFASSILWTGQLGPKCSSCAVTPLNCFQKILDDRIIFGVASQGLGTVLVKCELHLQAEKYKLGSDSAVDEEWTYVVASWPGFTGHDAASCMTYCSRHARAQGMKHLAVADVIGLDFASLQIMITYIECASLLFRLVNLPIPGGSNRSNDMLLRQRTGMAQVYVEDHSGKPGMVLVVTTCTRTILLQRYSGS